MLQVLFMIISLMILNASALPLGGEQGNGMTDTPNGGFKNQPWRNIGATTVNQHYQKQKTRAKDGYQRLKPIMINSAQRARGYYKSESFQKHKKKAYEKFQRAKVGTEARMNKWSKESSHSDPFKQSTMPLVGTIVATEAISSGINHAFAGTNEKEKQPQSESTQNNKLDSNSHNDITANEINDGSFKTRTEESTPSDLQSFDEPSDSTSSAKA